MHKSGSKSENAETIDGMKRQRFHNFDCIKEGMAFITANDAENALRHGLPVYALHCDNTKTLITQYKDIIDHIYTDGYFGMSKETRSFLSYLTAIQQGKAPSARDEFDLSYRSMEG